MYHQLLDALSCLPCLHQDFQGGIIERFGYDCWEHIFLCILCFAIIVLFLYYANRIFLFKHDKYRKYFAEFDKKKKYLLYYSIYVVSLIVQLATFYLLLNSA